MRVASLQLHTLDRLMDVILKGEKSITKVFVVLSLSHEKEVEV